MTFSFDQLRMSFIEGLQAIPSTLLLIVVPFIVSSVVALLIVAIRLARVPVLVQVVSFLLAVQRGIPLYLFILLGHVVYLVYFNQFVTALHLSIRVDDVNILFVAAFIISWAFVPMFTETYWGAVLAVPQGQYEAGEVVGLTRWQILRRLVFPQMLANVVPSLTNLLIGLMKGSALSFLIGVMDVMNSSLQSAMKTYNLVESYIASALIYWAIALIIELAMKGVSAATGKYRQAIAR